MWVGSPGGGKETEISSEDESIKQLIDSDVKSFKNGIITFNDNNTLNLEKFDSSFFYPSAFNIPYKWNKDTLYYEYDDEEFILGIGSQDKLTCRVGAHRYTSFNSNGKGMNRIEFDDPFILENAVKRFGNSLNDMKSEKDTILFYYVDIIMQ